MAENFLHCPDICIRMTSEYFFTKKYTCAINTKNSDKMTKAITVIYKGLHHPLYLRTQPLNKTTFPHSMVSSPPHACRAWSQWACRTPWSCRSARGQRTSWGQRRVVCSWPGRWWTYLELVARVCPGLWSGSGDWKYKYNTKNWIHKTMGFVSHFAKHRKLKYSLMLKTNHQNCMKHNVDYWISSAFQTCTKIPFI